MGDEGWQPRPSTWGRNSRPVLKPLPRDTACPSCVQKITASHSHGAVCSCASQREHAVKVHGGPKCLLFVLMAAPWNPGARAWPAPTTPRRRQNGGRADLHVLAWTVTLPCLQLALVYRPQGLWSLTDLRGQLPPPPLPHPANAETCSAPLPPPLGRWTRSLGSAGSCFSKDRAIWN